MTRDLIEVYDSSTTICYQVGEYLGHGAFGACYQFRDKLTRKLYAGKVLEKTQFCNKVDLQRLPEVAIQRKLKHRNVVSLVHAFEDRKHVYLVMELCKELSLSLLVDGRRSLTEIESRYYMKQLIEGVSYLHQNKIIHRDLKLGNLLLSKDLQVKIGDFGLSVQLRHKNEKVTHGCGSHLPPEMLERKPYSFKVDVWAIGCIMYKMLTGFEPFDADTDEEYYKKILKVDYKSPTKVSFTARNMIWRILQQNPDKRAEVSKLLKDPWFVNGYLPKHMPRMALCIPPTLNELKQHDQRMRMIRVGVINSRATWL